MIIVIRSVTEYIMEERLTRSISGKKNMEGMGTRYLLPQSGYVQQVISEVPAHLLGFLLLEINIHY
jgi:hypothetical protein